MSVWLMLFKPVDLFVSMCFHYAWQNALSSFVKLAIPLMLQPQELDQSGTKPVSVLVILNSFRGACLKFVDFVLREHTSHSVRRLRYWMISLNHNYVVPCISQRGNARGQYFNLQEGV